VLAVLPGERPCLRCVLGDRPAPGSSPTCDTAGVIAPIVQVVAALQATEALKLLAGRREALLPGLVNVDVWQGTFDVLDLSRELPRLQRSPLRLPRRAAAGRRRQPVRA
jgi:adenylyltransferase/sulfurtransferase